MPDKKTLENKQLKQRWKKSPLRQKNQHLTDLRRAERRLHWMECCGLALQTSTVSSTMTVFLRSSNWCMKRPPPKKKMLFYAFLHLVNFCWFLLGFESWILVESLFLLKALHFSGPSVAGATDVQLRSKPSAKIRFVVEAGKLRTGPNQGP